MGRTTYAAMSLVAAIPAAFLVFLMTMAFLSHADTMPGALPAVAGVTLLLSAVVAVTPVGILLFGGTKTRQPPMAAVATKSVDEPEVGDSSSVDEESVSGDESEWGDSEELEAESSDEWDAGESETDLAESDFLESEEFEYAETSEFESDESDAVESDEFEFDDNLSDEFDVDFDFDDDDETK